MEFHQRRRQQFLGQQRYEVALTSCDEGIRDVEHVLRGALTENDHRYAQGRARTIAEVQFDRLTLRYTAGESIEPLRQELEQVIAGYERYGELLWKYRRDRNEVVFDFTTLDDYCQLMQLIGLCFLLHRRDLLPRLAALQDGEQGHNGGADTLYEEFMAYGIGPDTRYESDWLCHKKPYEPLFHGLTETTHEKALEEFHRYLKRWYKDLAGTAWHDSHKPDEKGGQGGYYGYWSFEAGAAVLLLGIEDDSSLHQYLYYPKDLVAWARAHKPLGETPTTTAAAFTLRSEAGHPCPRTGWWSTPAQADSRRLFQQGEVLPSLGGDYGLTLWQWDERQD